MTGRFFVLGLMFCLGGAASAEVTSGVVAMPSAPAVVLWSGGAPGALGSEDKDVPTLTPWLAPADKATGAAMVVCPGGGYHALAPHEGADYARWLNEQGIGAFVLKYRLGSGGYHHPAMLNDVSRAIRMVRANAVEWKIDPKRVGVIGSSAGGHLASTALTHFDAGDVNSADLVKRQSSRPDLGVLIYPVITMRSATHGGSRKNLLGENATEDLVKLLSNDEQVTSDTPQTFIYHTTDDSVVPVENALLFAGALSKVGVPYELHVYPHGKHGIGLGTKEWNPAKRHDWTRACERWLGEMGFGRQHRQGR